MHRVLVVNGPNLNLLGTRHPEVYGSTALGELEDACRAWGQEVGLEVDTFQSNHEGELIDRIHAARGQVEGIVINPGALTHYSYALHDALEAVEVPAVEIHISNIEERETWRRVSVVRPACVHTIYGRGAEGYRWALRHLAFRSQWPFETHSYGHLPDQVFDLRLPAGASNPPLVVLLHGGFWRHMWTRDLMDGLSVEFTRHGFVTANLEYRRVGKGGGWPITVDDVVAGIRRAVEQTSPPRLVIVGHSAGGHLALVAPHHLDSDTPPPLVVSLAGITDLVAALEDRLGGGAAEEFLAGQAPEPASPLHQLPSRFPTIVIHGDRDSRVPVTYSQRYSKASGADLTVLEGGDHFGFLDPGTEMASAVVKALTTPL